MTFRELLQLLTGEGQSKSDEVFDAIAMLGERGDRWHHVTASWDMAKGSTSLVIDDKVVEPREDLRLPDDLVHLSADSFCELYLSNRPGDDVAVEANRRRFIDKDGRPVSLMNQKKPPLMYMPMVGKDNNEKDIGDFIGDTADSESGVFSVWMTTDEESI